MKNSVSFPISKLLKEHEFSEMPPNINSETDYVVGYEFDEDFSEPKEIEFQFEDHKRYNYYLAPTIFEVIEWLYKTHKIWIFCWKIGCSEDFVYTVQKRQKENRHLPCIENIKESLCEDEFFNSFQEAYEAAIEYTLKKFDMIKPYKLKHIPTGLYYQPHKHRGSNLSKKGKIYQNNTHGLSIAYKHSQIHNDLESRTFTVFVEKDSIVHIFTKNILEYRECSRGLNQLKAETLLKDWVKEEL